MRAFTVNECKYAHLQHKQARIYAVNAQCKCTVNAQCKYTINAQCKCTVNAQCKYTVNALCKCTKKLIGLS